MTVYAILGFDIHEGRLRKLAEAWNLGDFSFFTRGTTQKAMLAATELSIGIAQDNAFARLDSDRVPQLEDLPIPGLSIFIHQAEGKSIALILGSEYKNTTAYQCGKDAMALLGEAKPSAGFAKLLTAAQDVQSYDQFERAKAEVGETHEIMINNLDKVLQRGENLDDLVEKTQVLSDASESFLKSSKKLNRCCPGLWRPW